MPVFMHRAFTYCPSKPRSHLLRLLIGLLGLVLLAVLVVVGLFVGLGMLLFAAVRRVMRPSQRTTTVEDALDGEFTVVEKRSTSLSLR
jgi:membrane protein implicated in regulation of membrane protease activity